MFVRGLLPTDWPRLEYYASKIRALTILSSHGTTQVDKSFFASLATYRPVRNSFSNLQKIIMDIDSERRLDYDSLPYIDFLLTQNTLHISVELRPTCKVSHISLLLLKILRLCPNLRELNIGTYWATNLVLEAAGFQAIYNMHNLRSLDLGTFKPPDGMIGRILHRLGSMASLETLDDLYIPTEVQSLDGPGRIPPPLSIVDQWSIVTFEISAYILRTSTVQWLL